jgi:hypothetical protein
MTLPRLWVGLMCLFAVVAALDVTTGDTGIRWHASLGAVSLTAVGLIWLPAAIRFLFLVGGSVKAAGVEASAGGLLTSPDELIGDLAKLRSATEQIGQGPPDPTSTARSIDAAIDSIAMRYLPSENVLSEEILSREARNYEQIRSTMPPGDTRTRTMNTLANEVRIRAAAAPVTAHQYAPTFLRSARAGDRIVGIALVEGAPTADQFDDLLRILSTSASAFEQNRSLRALNEIAPILTSEQQSEAIAVLQREKTDPRGVGLLQDTYIPLWIDRVIDSMRRALTTPPLSGGTPGPL